MQSTGALYVYSTEESFGVVVRSTPTGQAFAHFPQSGQELLLWRNANAEIGLRSEVIAPTGHNVRQKKRRLKTANTRMIPNRGKTNERPPKRGKSTLHNSVWQTGFDCGGRA